VVVVQAVTFYDFYTQLFETCLSDGMFVAQAGVIFSPEWSLFPFIVPAAEGGTFSYHSNELGVCLHLGSLSDSHSSVIRSLFFHLSFGFNFFVDLCFLC